MIDSTIRSGTLPWTRSCFVCGEENPHGLHLKSRVEDGDVVLEHMTRQEDLGYRHLVHGGISMTLLDEVMTWAAILSTRRMCVAAELTVRLKRPIVADQRINVRAGIPAGKSRVVKTTAVITGDDGRVLASASGKYVPMGGDVPAACAEDFVGSSDSLDPSDLFSGA
jgi:uncharacterized protein (TIGR00369 family)